jgi:hypothetical protein
MNTSLVLLGINARPLAQSAVAAGFDVVALDAFGHLDFRRLAIFVDGCAWEAAEQVCMAAGELTIDLMEGLASLVDKSLLRQEEQAEGEARFWMLQTLREFGLERLNSEGEAEATPEMHAQYFLLLSDEAEPFLR